MQTTSPLFFYALSLLATGGLVTLLACFFETQALELRRILLPTLPPPKTPRPLAPIQTEPVACTPLADLPGPKVLFFSDLHYAFFFLGRQTFLETVLHLAPQVDLVLFGGDLSALSLAVRLRALRYLGKLAQGLQAQGVRLYAIRGNHDVGLSCADYEAQGIRLLENEAVYLHMRSGDALRLWGSDALDPLPPPCEAGWPTLWLAHNPDNLLALSPEYPLYFVAGHFHGGQMALPWQIEFRFLRPEQLGKAGITRGAFVRGAVVGYLTRGLGCVLLPFRLASRPELSLLILGGQKSE